LIFSRSKTELGAESVYFTGYPFVKEEVPVDEPTSSSNKNTLHLENICTTRILGSGGLSSILIYWKNRYPCSLTEMTTAPVYCKSNQ
jgi:hypothetical protein